MISHRNTEKTMQFKKQELAERMSGFLKECNRKSKDGKAIAIREGSPHQKELDLGYEE